MELTHRLRLPYLASGQAQKHVTYNEALRALDQIIATAVQSRDLSAPPSSPSEGQAWIVAEAGTGEWVNHDGDLAAWQDSAWRFHTPQAGWVVWLAAEAVLLVHNGSDWQHVPEPDPQFDSLGIAATADDVNRLALSSEASLFTHAGAGHQIKVNKALSTDTASLVFQSG